MTSAYAPAIGTGPTPAYSYDARGNLIEVACYGIDGKPTLSEDGYARVTRSYDALGNVTEVAHYGIDGGLLSR
jgi:YD repeat-containing protein